MSKINIGRVIMGGLLAGLIINIFEYVLNAIVLASQWQDVQSAHGLTMGTNEIIWFNVLGFLLGIVAVWTYAAIRPRFGAGVKTAIFAALLTWVTAYVFCDAMPTIVGLFPLQLMLTMVGVGLIEIIVATIAGAWLYKE